MTIEDRMKEALAEENEREKNPNFQNLRDFYEEMKREGVAIKHPYSLPPVDTVGRSLYDQIANKSSPSE